MNDRISKTVERLAPSGIRAFFDLVLNMKDVISLGVGEPDFVTPWRIREKAIASLEEGFTSYTSNKGMIELRRAIGAFLSGRYGLAYDPEDEILLTVGVSEGVDLAVRAILNPGDKVLVSTPYFVEYGFYVDNHGGVLEPVPGGPGFDLDLNALEARMDKTTAAVIINSPNNPTGKIYDEDTIGNLGALLERKSRELGRTIYLISDEPYRKIVFDGAVVPSVFRHYRNSFAVTSYSKDLSLPGERIGWLAIHPEAEDRKNLVSGAVLCNRILGYVNAPALMQRVVGRLQGHTVDIDLYRRKRDLLCRGLSEVGFRFDVPRGTFYLFPEAPGGDDLKAVDLLREERILTVPGRGFGAPGYFRISFCVDDAVIENSLAGFRRAFARMG